MGTILAQTIVDSCSAELRDLRGVEFTVTTLLGFFNDGQKAICILKPSSLVKNEAVKLVAGAKQSIPAGGTALIDIVRNMGADGLTVGNSITVADRKVLEAFLPGWSMGTGNAVVKNFMFDEHDQRTYYVYPPQPAASQGYVEIAYGLFPTDIAIGTAITLDDIYVTVLKDYIMYRALRGKYEEIATSRLNAFYQALGVKGKREIIDSPNTEQTKGQGG